MNKCLITLFFLSFVLTMNAQTTIVIMDFDGTTTEWGFSVDFPFFDNGMNGFFGIHNSNANATDGTPSDTGVGDIPASIGFTNDFLFGNDVADNGQPTITITFNDVDITAYTDVTISFDYDVVALDNADNFTYTPIFDGVDQATTTIGNMSNFSAEGNVSIDVPASTTTLALRLSVTQSGNPDYLGFDNFLVEGTPIPVVGFDNTTSSIAEGDAGTSTHMIPVTVSNYQGTPVVVVVRDDSTGTAAFGGVDYTFAPDTLTFMADGTQNVSVTIVGETEPEFDETILLSLDTLTGTVARLVDASHTATITNDDADLVVGFINEIHYDNMGVDVGEFVEVAVRSNYPGDLSDLDLTLYNGVGGASDATHNLSTFTAGDTHDGFIFYTKLIAGLGDGTNGLALSISGTVIEFLSYEGTFTATDGPANGTMSVDIGVSEDDGTTAVGASLQRTGSCSFECPTGLTWTGPVVATSGSINASEILPVVLHDFGGYLKERQIHLNWQTASETNNHYMAIERSTDGVRFAEIGRVQGAGTTTLPQQYQYIDKQPTAGANYYRLRQVDFDGTASYSPVIMIQVSSGNGKLRILPTETADWITISIDDDTDNNKSLEVFDLNGRLLYQTSLSNRQNSLDLDVTNFPAGQYIVRLLNGSDTQTNRFFKR